MTSDEDDRIIVSWADNAGRWAEAVRKGTIRSRGAGTDAAIIEAITRLRPGSVLDLGCGEGWLARRLARDFGCRIVGVDGSAELVRLARDMDPAGDYRHLDYAAIAADPALLSGPFDAVTANFALLSEEIAGLLRALLQVAPRGALVIQTVHPWVARSDGPYKDGWREETFAGFGADGWSRMPWFYRTLASWHGELTAAGWQVDAVTEPTDAENGQPLSLLLSCTPRPAAQIPDATRRAARSRCS